MSSLRKVKKERKKKEEKARQFSAALDTLKTLRYETSGYSGIEETVFTVRGDMVLRSYIPSFLKSQESRCFDEPFGKRAAFCEGLRALNIHEWKRRYSDDLILDGMRWELELVFGGRYQLVRIRGYNAYPEQFDALLELLGLEENDEQDQD